VAGKAADLFATSAGTWYNPPALLIIGKGTVSVEGGG
jgi:hypothetical protein